MRGREGGFEVGDRGRGAERIVFFRSEGFVLDERKGSRPSEEEKKTFSSFSSSFSPSLSLSLARAHLALSRSLSVEPTICLTFPLWMSMQGRKAEVSARALATRWARRRWRFLVEGEEGEPLEKTPLLLPLFRPLLLATAVLMLLLERREHAADRASIAIASEKRAKKERERGRKRKKKVKFFTPLMETGNDLK